MKHLLCILLLNVLALHAMAQAARNNIPESVIRKGYGLQKSAFVQMDSDPQSEHVFLFGHDNGHWPEFDLFKSYIAVVDTKTGEVEYMSDEFVTDKYNVNLDDRDSDGLAEMYYYYIDMNSFTTDADGYHPAWNYKYERISQEGKEGEDPHAGHCGAGRQPLVPRHRRMHTADPGERRRRGVHPFVGHPHGELGGVQLDVGPRCLEQARREMGPLPLYAGGQICL